jgi:hypothetical protein
MTSPAIFSLFLQNMSLSIPHMDGGNNPLDAEIAWISRAVLP